MPSRMSARLILIATLAAALPAAAQSLRPAQRGEPGLDPSFARGWLAPSIDRFGFANYRWNEPLGLAPRDRMDWSYEFGDRGSLGMSYGSGRNYDPTTAIDGRQFGLIGRYSLSPDWSLNAEAVSREPGALLRLQDFRIGVQRRF